MRFAKLAILVGAVAPLCVSGVMEWLGVERTSGTNRHWPDVELDFARVENGYRFFEPGTQKGAAGEVRFESLWSAESRRGVLFASSTHSRRMLQVLLVDHGFLDPDDAELGAIRTALQEHLSASGASAQLINEIAQPDVNRTTINWLGVYINGVAALLMLAFAGIIVWLPMRELQPAARGRRRFAAGHCPDCDYDLRGTMDAGCPECGWGKLAARGLERGS